MANPKQNVDWVAVEGAYRAGVDSLRTMAERYGISEAAIRKRAKKLGWTRDPGSTKRAIVNAHFAQSAQTSIPDGAHDGSQSVLRTIEQAAGDDIVDMERGLRINRHCLLNLEVAAEKVSEPKEIKVIVEATSLAIAAIRKIRGLDAPSSADTKDIDAAIEEELAKLGAGRQAGVTADAEGA